MDTAAHVRLLGRYREAAQAFVIAVDHVAPLDLDARPEPKAWSARQIVHHLADAEVQESVRLRRMLAENTPVLLAWDGRDYASRLHYDRPVESSLETFRALTGSNLELLAILTPEQWRRDGNQMKPWTLNIESWLEDETDHIRGHLLQLLNAPSGGRALPDP